LGASYEEGTPLDAGFFLVLIVLGIRTLARRGVWTASLVRENRWIFLFLAYCFAAILWSDFPFVAFKRWIKVLGHPVMALVILTDPRPTEALRLVLLRCSAIMLPLSVLFVKYLPQYSRMYDPWTGQPQYCGINLNKNELGYCCMAFGLYLVWNLTICYQIKDPKQRREELLVSAILLLMAAWLLKLAQSTTSLITLLTGSVIVTSLRTNLIPKRFFGTFVVSAIILAATAELTIGVYRPLVELFGKDVTLTDRTLVWSDVISMVEWPLVGTGFESFWLGSRLDSLWEKWWWKPNQAHNGYIEVYLNLGIIGLVLLAGMLLSTFRRISALLSYDLDFARLRMAFLFAIVLYNFTEASFKALHILWTIFYLVALRLPSEFSPRSRSMELRMSPENNNSLGVRSAY
jgi:O-antigen ligase